MEVKDKIGDYRARYKDGGKPENCGDWLAIKLDEICGRPSTDTRGRKRRILDLSRFDEILDANGVERTGKWAKLPISGQKGWQGRYRMNGRQKLEVIVAKKGFLRVPAGDLGVGRNGNTNTKLNTLNVEAPIEWCMSITRRKRWGNENLSK